MLQKGREGNFWRQLIYLFHIFVAEGDDCDEGWDTEFDDDEDDEIDTGLGSADTSGEWPSSQIRPSEVNTPNGLPTGKPLLTSPSHISLPDQPDIPSRKPKIVDGTTASSSQIENQQSESPSTVAANNKPAVLPKPKVATTNVRTIALGFSLPGTLPRPPSGGIQILRPSPPRNSRPTDLPPPPPADRPKSQFGADEYEIPNPCGSSSDTTSTSSNTSSFHPDISLETYEKIEPSDDGGDDHSQWSTGSSRNSSSDQPVLPPKYSPALSTPPPLPQKPSHDVKLDYAEKKAPSRTTVPLPRGPSTSGDESSEKARSRKFSFPQKLSSILSKTNSSGFLYGDQLPNKPSSSSSTVSRKNTAKNDSNRMNSPRSSIDDGSVQSRPLPPVPDTLVTSGNSARHQLPSLTFDSPARELMDSFAWFHGVEREVAELKLKESQKNGCYLVRPSRRAGEGNPFTLTVLYNQRVFHLNIRLVGGTRFALGKEKANEKIFNSVEELISFHQNEPIILTTKGQNAGSTRLVATPSRR